MGTLSAQDAAQDCELLKLLSKAWDALETINSLGSTAGPPEMLARTKMQSPIRYRLAHRPSPLRKGFPMVRGLKRYPYVGC